MAATKLQKGKEQEKLPRSATSELGVSGEMAASSFFNEERRIDDLRLRDYRRMKQNDGQVAMILNAIVNTILSTGFELGDDPTFESEEDSEEKKFVEGNLFNPEWKGGMCKSFNFTNRENMRALEEGFIVQEVVYRRDSDGFIRLDKLAPRISRLSDLEVQVIVDEHGNYNGFRQVTSFMERAVDVTVVNDSDIAKSINVVWGAEYGSNYGRPLLKPIWYHYDKAHKLLYILHVGTELGSVKYRTIKQKGNTDKTKDAAMMAAAIRVGQEAVIMYNDQEYEMTFEEVTDAAVMAQGIELMKHHTSQMAKAALAQFSDLGSALSATGSRSLGSEQMDFFKIGLEAVGDILVCEPWNKIIADLVKVNFNNGIFPVLKMKPLQDDTVKMLYDAFLELVKKGSIPEEVAQELIEKTGEKLGLDISEEAFTSEPIIKSPVVVAPQAPTSTQPVVDKNAEMADPMSMEMNTEPMRMLYPDEQKVRLADIKIRLDDATVRATAILSEKLAQQKSQIVEEYVKASREGRRAVKTTTVELADTTSYSQALYAIAAELVEYGKILASGELQKSVPETPKKDRQYTEDSIDSIVTEQQTRLTLRLQQVANRGLQNQISESDLRIQLDTEYQSFFDSILPPTVSAVVPESFNFGRQVAFDKYESVIFAYRYTAVLDSHTTDYCRELDGKVLQTTDPNFAMLTPPNHFGCRSIWTPITISEAKEYNTTVTGKPDMLPVYPSISAFKDTSLSDIEKELIDLL